MFVKSIIYSSNFKLKYKNTVERTNTKRNSAEKKGKDYF